MVGASTRQLIVTKPARSIAAASATVVVPAIISNSGEHATRSFRKFFATTIRNKNTRAAYLHAVSRFFAWCEHHKPGRLADIEPLHVAAYIKALGKYVQKPTVKQHLAAIRMLFDWLVAGQVVVTNPARAVRGPRYVVKTGKITALDVMQVHKILDSIDSSSVVGLRDRALISVMTFAFARIGVVVAMHVKDYYPNGKDWWVRLNEKGGKRHEMPAHETLKANLKAYIDAAGLRDGGEAPLFRTAAGCSGTLTDKPIGPVGVWRMIQRRAAFVGINARIGCHTFRATGIRAYLEAGGTLENARAMAAHVSPRTTKLYDCADEEESRARAEFRSVWIIACCGEHVDALCGRDEVDDASDGGPQRIDGACGLLAQKRLELGEGFLDWVEVGAVGRQVSQCRAGRLDQGPHTRALVAGQIVHDHDVALTKIGDENVLHPGFEDRPVDRAVDDKRGDDAAVAQAGDEGGRLPMPVRHAHPQPLATPTAAVASGHVGAGPTLVHEDQPVGIKIDLALEPIPTLLQDIGTVLLGGVRGLFLRVRLCRAKKRHSVP